jgi:hypothetical protein
MEYKQCHISDKGTYAKEDGTRQTLLGMTVVWILKMREKVRLFRGNGG